MSYERKPYFFPGRFTFVIEGAMIKAPTFKSDRQNNAGSL